MRWKRRFGLRENRLPRVSAIALLALALGLFASLVTAEAQTEAMKVDAELVLAVDVSWSMNHDEQLIQRNGYVAAFRSKPVKDAILDGAYGRIAVTYVEWASYTTQVVVVPWTVIDSAAAADAFSDKLTMVEPVQLRRTSISGAIDFARKRFAAGPYKGLRKILDISGDGPNNDGRPVTEARDQAVAEGITINGLPLMTNPNDEFSLKHLDRYYSDCVMGGGSSFVIPVTSWEQFPVALQRKLVQELAETSRPPEDRRAYMSGETLPVVRVAAGKTPKTDCMAGEEMWQKRWQMWNAQ